MSKRQLAAIMFTDIVGYTALMGKDSNKAMELVRKSKTIQKPLVEKNNGKWLKEMGDGAMAQFGTALDAVNCALEIQQSASVDFEAKIRIGIHSGDITIENDDVYGDGVNVASRLESIADPGGIYISDAIEKAMRGQSNIQAKYLGEINLKNVDYGVRTYALQGDGLPVPDLKKSNGLSGHFLAEIYRRGIIRAGIMYLLISFILVLLQPIASNWITFPDSFRTILYTILGIGFPIAVYLAWRYERSPEGFVLTSSPQSRQSPHSAGRQKPLTSNIFIGILLLAILGLSAYNNFRFNSSIDTENIEKSIAVLPFRNDSPNEENLYFCNGIMEGILDHLSKIPELTVSSRTSVEKYRENLASISIGDIGRELNVNYALEGSVLRIGNRVKITAQLIYTPENKHLWSGQFDKNIENPETIFEVLADVTQRIARELRTNISPEIVQRIEYVPTTDLKTYEYYLQGRDYFNNYFRTSDKSNLVYANRLYDLALVRDPTFGLPYAGKAGVFVQSWSVENRLDSVLKYTNKAISLDPNAAFAYMVRGAGYYQQINDLERAISDIEKAVEMEPNDVNLRQLAAIYSNTGDYIGSWKLFKRAQQIGRDSWSLSTNYTMMAYNVYLPIGDTKKALSSFQKAIELEPLNQSNLWWYYILVGKGKEALKVVETMNQNPGLTYLHMRGKSDSAVFYMEQAEAKRQIEEGENYNAKTAHSRYGIALVNVGKTKEGMEIITYWLERLEPLIKAGTATNEMIYKCATIHAFLGDGDKTIEYLKKIDENYSWGPIFVILQTDPLLDSIRDRQEFKEILNKNIVKQANIRKQINQLDLENNHNLR